MSEWSTKTLLALNEMKVCDHDVRSMQQMGINCDIAVKSIRAGKSACKLIMEAVPEELFMVVDPADFVDTKSIWPSRDVTSTAHKNCDGSVTKITVITETWVPEPDFGWDKN